MTESYEVIRQRVPRDSQGNELQPILGAPRESELKEEEKADCARNCMAKWRKKSLCKQVTCACIAFGGACFILMIFMGIEDRTLPDHQREVRWFNSTNIIECDYYSSAWLMPLEKFMQTETENMHCVEDASHRVFENNRANVRMSVDWMNFAVEHMSKWWKIMGSIHEQNNSVSIDRINDAFAEYIRSSTEQVHSPNRLSPTIAIVAFMSYVKQKKGPRTIERSTNLTILSLGATVSSLSRVGFGRIVVVGTQQEDEMLVQKAFELQKISDSVDYAYVQVLDSAWHKTKFCAVNVPHAAIVGLQLAFNGSLSATETNVWLGEEQSKWKYVYLTEPDTILQTRQSSLKAIRDALDDGMVLMPHRLQPIPHWTDVAGDSSLNFLKKVGKFAQKPVIILDRETDACCDRGIDHPNKEFPKCNTAIFWYICGFNNQQYQNETEYEKVHERLLPYDFIRIDGGTGIVSIAGSEHGRQCQPQKVPGFIC